MAIIHVNVGPLVHVLRVLFWPSKMHGIDLTLRSVFWSGVLVIAVVYGVRLIRAYRADCRRGDEAIAGLAAYYRGGGALGTPAERVLWTALAASNVPAKAGPRRSRGITGETS